MLRKEGFLLPAIRSLRNVVRRDTSLQHPVHCWARRELAMGYSLGFSPFLTEVDNVAQTAPSRFPVPVPEMGNVPESVPELDTGGERRLSDPP